MVPARLILYLTFVAYLGLAILDVRHPDSIVLATLMAAVIAMSFRSPRVHLMKIHAKSRIVRAVDLVLWTTFVSFLLLEVLLAGAYWVTSESILMRPNARSQERIAGYKDSLADRPDADPRNAQGFNDTEWSNPKPPRTLRIAALGDSFAFGIVGYRANFLTLLEHGLNEKGEQRVEVCNLGIPSLDPIDYLEILNSEGMLLEPDLVLVCLFSGNDFVNRSRGSQLRLRNTRIFSVFWRLSRLRVEQNRRRSQGLQDRISSVEGFQTAPLSVKTHLEVTGRYLEFLMNQYGQETEEKISDTLEVLEQIKIQVGADRLFIAVLPNEVQVNPRLRQELCLQRGISESELDLFRPGREISAHFASSGVKVVDLLPAFLKAEREAATYRSQDTHWNLFGNEVAAAALLPHLASTVKSIHNDN